MFTFIWSISRFKKGKRYRQVFTACTFNLICFSEGSHIIKCWLTSHEEEEKCPDFKFRIVGSFKDCLTRQVSEAVMIHYSKEILLNSKNENNSNCLTRLTVDENKFEKKTRERLEAIDEAKEKEAWEQFKKRKRKEGFLKRKKEEEIPGGTKSKKPRWSIGDQEPATPTMNTGEESRGGQEEMTDDLGICLERMEGICMRAGRRRKQLEFDKMRMVRRMDTLEQDNIMMDIHNILDERQPGVEDVGGAHLEVAADQIMDDPVPEERKTCKMIHSRKRKEDILIPDTRKVGFDR
jgi:hypothetical protein